MSNVDATILSDMIMLTDALHCTNISEPVKCRSPD